jgi:hypothetical protein
MNNTIKCREITPPVPLWLLTCAVFSASEPVEGSKDEPKTDFARLSKEAQDLIVRAMCGEFDKSGSPDISDSLKAEIHEWVEKGKEDSDE